MASSTRVECRPEQGLFVLDANHFPREDEWWTHALCCHRNCAEFPAVWAGGIVENRSDEQ